MPVLCFLMCSGQNSRIDPPASAWTAPLLTELFRRISGEQSKLWNTLKLRFYPPPQLCFISILFLFSPSLLRVKWALWGWFSSTLAHSDRRLKSGPDVVSTNIGLCLCSKFSVFKGSGSCRILFPGVSGEQYHCVKFARICRDWWTIAAEDNKKHFHPLVLQHKLKLFWGKRHTHGPFPAWLG